MISEIGSEFWLESMPEDESCAYVLSGRTAIDLILQDMEKEGWCAKNVCMPAWCCDSMLQPFLDRGVSVNFYDVCWENGSLRSKFDDNLNQNSSSEETPDILYVTNYFGYDSTLPVEIAKRFKEKGATVIYDRTHSLFRNDHEICYWANYNFGSIRKWMGVIAGAYVKKRGRKFNLPKLKECPYIKDKVEAMRLKSDYMSGNKSIDKQKFLDKYAQFGHRLAEDYRDYKMDSLSQTIWLNADKFALQKTRKANAKFLHEHLEEIPQVKLMFELKNGDCPLFVPVLLDSKEVRDTLRKHLTMNAIYCPVHWPQPSIIDASLMANDIYDRVLSLLCDQRYGLEDMQHIIDVIKKYYK